MKIIKKSKTFDVIDDRLKEVSEIFMYLPPLEKIVHLGGIADAIMKMIESHHLILVQYLEKNSFLTQNQPYEYTFWTVIQHKVTGEWVATGEDAAGDKYHYLDDFEKPIARNKFLIKALHIGLEVKDESTPLAAPSVPLTEFEYNVILEDLHGYPDIASSIMKHFKVESLQEIPRSEINNVRAQIKRIKRTHEDYIV